MRFESLDIFCEVIDNFGDIGVVYRLAKELKKTYNTSLQIRVIINRLDEFMQLNKNARDTDYQVIDDIIYIKKTFFVKNICTFLPANVIIEAFGCSLIDEYLERAKECSSLLINLEYLSGESWIEDVHLVESPLGDCKLKKIFFMPGFTKKSGGVIIDTLFLERKAKVLSNKEFYLDKFISDLDYKNMFIGTIFSYEKNFKPLIDTLRKNKKNNCLLVLGEKSQQSFLELFKSFNVSIVSENVFKIENITIKFMPFLEQEEYEELICAVDFNFARGEDSFIRVLLTGKPFLWHIYLQENFLHMDKLEGFIERYTETLISTDKNSVDIHTKLLRDYNFRETNNLDIGSEDYFNFFQNFEKIEVLTKQYSDFIISNCNLIDKLNRLILKY